MENINKEIAIYVSPDGKDDNTGSERMPFATPARATAEVRRFVSKGLECPVTVYFHAGNYKVEGIEMTAEHSGSKDCPVTYKSFGDGEVVFNGGVMLRNEDFLPVTDEKVLARFKPEVREKVKVLDLKKYGLTLGEIGKVYAFGTATTASKFDDGTVGCAAELFWGDERMTNARYPNEGYTEIVSVVDHGDDPRKVTVCPKGGTVTVSDEVREEMKLWAEPEKAWAFGKFYWMWADDSTPVSKINTEKGEVTLKHASAYDYKEGGVMYFFNVLEELDVEGEYFIDRDNMLVYAYPPADYETRTPMLSVSPSMIIQARDVEYIRFEGIRFCGVRGDIAKLSGNHIEVRNCKFSSSYGTALVIDGWENTVYGCEVCYMGRGGIRLSGGDRDNLIHANDKIENCRIHDFGQIYKTYQQGAWVSGCGNYIIHNEIYNTPHLSISYYGNENVVENNYVHDTVLESFDAGSLYVGGDWTSVGNVIRYNKFENTGSGKSFCSAIYFDDGMSGQTAYSNIIIGCSGPAFLLGGGRELVVRKNLIIDSDTGLFYDDRFASTGYCPLIKAKPGTGMWTTLSRVPIHSPLWRERYPLLDKITTDPERYLEKDYPANPAYSLLQHNIFVSNNNNIAKSESITTFSEVKENYECPREKVQIDDGSFAVDEAFIKENNIDWEQIAADKIGLYKE